MTKVDECTRADTGVGAAIAAGNQAEKGTCALLVILTKINSKSAASVYPLAILLYMAKDHLPVLRVIPTKMMIPASPNRLVRAVIMPALKDFSL